MVSSHVFIFVEMTHVKILAFYFLNIGSELLTIWLQSLYVVVFFFFFLRCPTLLKVFGNFKLHFEENVSVQFAPHVVITLNVVLRFKFFRQNRCLKTWSVLFVNCKMKKRNFIFCSFLPKYQSSWIPKEINESRNPLLILSLTFHVTLCMTGY